MTLAEISPGPTFSDDLEPIWGCSPYFNRWGSSFSFHIQTIQVYHYLSWHFLNSRVHLSYLLFPFPNFWWFPIFFFLFNPDWLFLQCLFLINWWLHYNVVLISAICQYELAIGIHMSPPSWISLLPPTHSRPSRLLQSPSSSSLSHVAHSRGLSIYTCLCPCVHATVPIHLDMQCRPWLPPHSHQRS